MKKITKYLPYIIVIAIIAPTGLLYILTLPKEEFHTLSVFEIYELIWRLILMGISFFVGYKFSPQDESAELSLEIDRKDDNIQELKEEVVLLKKEIDSRDKRIEKISKLSYEIQDRSGDMIDTEDVAELFDEIEELKDRTYDVGID